MLLELPIIDSLNETLSDFRANSIYYFCLFVLIPISIISSFICLIWVFRRIRSFEAKTSKMREINAYIQKGAKIYLKQQARTLFIAVAILFFPVGFTGIGYLNNPIFGFFLTGGIFLIGATCSLTAGYIGMKNATKVNILVVEASIKDPKEGFKLAYYGGMITGILNISMLVIGIWLIIILTQANVYLMIGFSFGASVTSLLTQVGGGIFTKSADIGADMVGKYEMSIKEDDPNNPAVIADLIGDNVGDCAARGADLFESTASDVISGMILGIALYKVTGEPIFIITNLTLISLGMFSLFVTMKFLNVDFNKPSKSVWNIFAVATVANVIILLFLNLLLFGHLGIYLFLSSVIGLLATVLTIVIVVIYTNVDYKRTRRVAKASIESPTTNILSGLSSGLSATVFPIIVFVFSVIIAFFFGSIFGNLYFAEVLGSKTVDELGNNGTFQILIISFGSWGVCMASASSDILISTILSFDTFGPIMDNAAGIVAMSEDETPKNLRDNLARLDALGNTTKAVSKGFALICGGLSSIVLFFSFLMSTNSLAYEYPTLISADQLFNIFTSIHIFNPLIIGGIFIGMILPFLYASQLIRAVVIGARGIVQEVRRQFNEIPGLREGKAKPDYDKCIIISSKNALKNMIKPVLIVIVTALLVGILLGPFVVAGFLLGNLIGCLILGFFLSIGGATFDNAKKIIESGLYGGNGSFAHKNAIIGDTIGDPMKDTAGPSMSSLITTINTISLTFLPIFMMTGYLWLILPI